MILELYINNFALVEEVRLNFENGLNILTGETGSGKSIIIDALNLCLGGRFDKSFVRKGTNKGLIEATFNVSNEKLENELLEYGIDTSLDKNIIISREIYADGKNISRINGRNVRLSFLKNISSFLIDVHSQHENQVLFNKEKHIEFLDLYGEEKLKILKDEYLIGYKKYTEIKNKLNSLTENKDDIQIAREIDLLKFQIDEIEDANLSAEEYEELLKQREVHRNSEKIYTNLNKAYLNLYESNINAFDLISKALKDLGDLSNFDKKLEDYYSNLEDIMYRLQDLSKDVRDYKDNIDFDIKNLDDVEIRIDTINNLRRKYGNTIEEILEYKKKITLRLDEILSRDEKIIQLKESLEKIKEDLNKKSKKITLRRKEIAKELENKICNELNSLNMKNVSFKVNFEEREDFTHNGKDIIEFMISFNLGEDLKPIYKIASGGEMSRFMLAFKTILSDIDKVETLVFDEIDTGISGIAAQIVGDKLKIISNKKQIICITHLPQIAVNSDVHFNIEKITQEDRTYTRIEKLTEEDKVQEIARLIGGLNITQKTIEHAKELLQIAKNKDI
ncbi:DNA repair protein RecN [Tepidibacter formicigenes]|jgi:DNA repair protein RecN (Recombination protein N)|uniref:DNA repair protein RecN n=1 Tax=Tepidibacter formicigenes DSM 15518 TaxID=1123349 RepID=A0A1M6L225_9FIRM|nr:DNA repair protein RecN [Tepidibacter formicigenes]SHJ65186.1 DNA repair protein RecN (Recombination protein N) [Tepidibacter formicigenes DSM 15518]